MHNTININQSNSKSPTKTTKPKQPAIKHKHQNQHNQQPNTPHPRNKPPTTTRHQTPSNKQITKLRKTQSIAQTRHQHPNQIIKPNPHPKVKRSLTKHSKQTTHKCRPQPTLISKPTHQPRIPILNHSKQQTTNQQPPSKLIQPAKPS